RWGAILVAEEDLERAQELLADFLEAEVEPPVLGPYRTEAHEDKGVGAYESLHARTRRGARALLLLFVALPLLLLSLSLLLRLILRR
ncbi:MAG: hypothetical protein OEY14_01270, partial [Myxococcales bacterium]|nr:hypothetical protein [Myxococcales bacterium]